MATSAIETANQENGSRFYLEHVIENNKEPTYAQMIEIYDGYNQFWRKTYQKQANAVKEYIKGEKGYEYFHKRDYNVVKDYKDFWTNLNYGNAISIGLDLIQSFLNHDVDNFKVIYNYFKNTASQQVIVDCLLPLEFEKNNNELTTEIIYEPSKIEIVQSLVPKFLNTQIWKYLLESFASEQAARMLAMENATDNAKDMINDLKLEFNKARQTAITTEMLEIVGGAEALSN